jgi:cyclophilin family peptidyl-prolyl cis-trans isomerase
LQPIARVASTPRLRWPGPDHAGAAALPFSFAVHLLKLRPQQGQESRMAEITDPENTIIMELKDGRVVIELLPGVAPKHVERMKMLARAGAYDNVVFHRVIDAFMAQTGDVEHGRADGGALRRAGTGGSDHPDLPAEFSKLPHDRGTLGAARSRDPNSANSQFFINFADNHFLNGQYTVYGRVIEGMAHVDAITRGEPPADPDRMISVKVAADV